MEERAYKELTSKSFSVESHLRFPNWEPPVDSDGVIIDMPLPGPFDTNGRWFTTEVELEPVDSNQDNLDWAEGCTVRIAEPKPSTELDEVWHGKVLRVRADRLFLITSLFPPTAWPTHGTSVKVEAFNYCRSAIDRLKTLIGDEEQDGTAAQKPPLDKSIVEGGGLALPITAHAGSGSRVYWGPAGTGKTYQIGADLIQRLEENQRCLALCATNNGADEIFLSALRKGGGAMPAGHLLRFGSTKTGELSLDGPWRKHLTYQLKEKETEERVHEITSKIQDLRRAKHAFQSNHDDSDIDAEIASLQEQRKQAWRDWADWKAQALANAKAVVGTNYFGVRQHSLLEEAGPWDVLFLDEASLVSVLHLGLLGTLSFQQAVLAGDFMQHRPFSHFDSLKTKAGKSDPHHWTNQVPPMDVEIIECLYHRSAFDQMGIQTIKDWRRVEDGDRFVSLTQQRRMDPALGDTVSKLFYEGCLESSKAPSDDEMAQILAPGLYWYDPQPHGKTAKSTMEKEVSDLLEKLMVMLGKDRKYVVMTSKRPAGQQWTQMLKRKFRQLELSTTNGIQGRNCDIALFHPSFWQESGGQGSFADWQRRCWTVALSRARHAAIILGSEEEARRRFTSKEQPRMFCLRSALEKAV